MKKVVVNIGIALILIGISMYIVGVLMFYDAQSEINKYANTRGASFISKEDQAAWDNANVQRDFARYMEYIGIGMLVLGIVSALYGRSADDEDAKPTSIVCQRCGKTFHKDNTHCPRCGLKILKKEYAKETL